MTRAEDVLYEIGNQGESQTVEFKASLGREKEAIQSMVAFANREGGWLFFGVTDDGTRKGVQIGKDTLEKLAAAIRDHTYPSLPVGIEAIPSRDGRKHIVAVEVPADVPPVIGVYVFSAKAIPPDKPVGISEVQAYRRVGRTNQKEDFMRLREPRPSDPRLRLEMTTADRSSDDASRVYFAGRAWMEEGSASAHGIIFQLSPGGHGSSDDCADLPYPATRRSDENIWPPFRYDGFTNAVDFHFRDLSRDDLTEPLEVTATYKDDWGLTWRVSRRIVLAEREESGSSWIEIQDRGEFTRRIVEFPPKAQ